MQWFNACTVTSDLEAGKHNRFFPGSGISWVKLSQLPAVADCKRLLRDRGDCDNCVTERHLEKLYMPNQKAFAYTKIPSVLSWTLTQGVSVPVQLYWKEILFSSLLHLKKWH